MNKKEVKLMQGNEACVEGALAAGLEFYAGYPITPSTEIAEICSEKLPLVGGKFIQMEDEIAGMAAIIGASLAGLKSMTATSGPGFSLKQENIGYAAMAQIPCVVVDVMRAGPSTGLPTAPSQGDVMQAKWGTHGDHPTISLTPNSVREAYDLTIRAFNLSEKYRTPVFLLMDEIIGHLRERIEIPTPDEYQVFNRLKPNPNDKNYKAYAVKDDEIVPRMASFGDGFSYHVTGLVYDEYGFPKTDTDVAENLLNHLMQKIENNVNDIITYEEVETQDAELLIVAYGGVARAAAKAVKECREQGMKVGLFRPITLWPFPEKRVNELSQKSKKVLVVEMNLGQYVIPVHRVKEPDCKVFHYGKVNGEPISPDEIIKKVKEAY
ncbi:2-oxoacid:acceptor oxidoreductase subunit alpha [Tindallia californiensis]|uniref:2-oxoglutarate ferredoxin oxidoreductase subunit alpha n=1 Tax=Tindallia californiensis TaxID=159292 RepID=A0A1H3NPE8_9FIRM|nr:2-oxoacid:acceptor oxidoreductase subunit alpha [Tindallia californiensis]SDY90049.1 2-oxoglutarate ferredoxin oxidoreductase subunit alpha [Tindallia californiensis]